jgi:hypothetical protein
VIAPARKHNVQSMIVSWGAGWPNFLRIAIKAATKFRP